MAEETISTLRIQITADNSQANKALDSTKKNLGSMSPALKQLKTTFKSTFGGLYNIISSFKKMALRLALRTLIKNMFSGLGESFKSYIAYSSEAKSAMDEFTTSAHYLSNSIAASLMPLLAKLIPIFSSIVDKIVDVINGFSNMAAWIQGKSTYSAAKKIAYEYGEEADKANDKTKALKRTILGFDEINALSKQSDSSSLNDTASSLKDIFEERAVDGTWAKEFLKWVTLIGAAFAGWKLGKIIRSLSSISGLAQGLIGLGMIVIGVALEYSGLKDYFKTGSKGSLTKGILGSIATMVGGVLVGSSMGHPLVGLTLGVAISGVTAIIAYRDAKIEKSQYYDFAQSVKRQVEENTEVLANVKVQVALTYDKTVESGRNFKEASEVLDKLYNIIEKGNYTPEDIEKINSYLSILQNMGFGDLVDQIGNVENGFSKTRQEAQKLLSDIQKIAYASLGKENLQNLLGEQSKIAVSLNDSKKVLKGYYDVASKDWIDLIEKQINDLQWNGVSDGVLKSYANQVGIKDFTKLSKATKEQLIEFAAILNSHGASGMSGIFLNDLYGNEVNLDDAISSYYTLTGQIKDLEGEYTNLGKESEYWAEMASGGLDDIISAVNNTQRSAVSAIQLFTTESGTIITDGLGNTYTDTTHTAKDIKDFIEKLDPTLTIYAKVDMSALKEITDNKDGISVTVTDKNGNQRKAGLVEGFRALNGFATGGFPEDGLFYANHNELVGTFSNGKTAVANNEQIVEGIKRGVAEGMSMNGGQGGNWTIQVVDDYGNIRGETIVTAIERYNRQAGKSVIQVN